jgi:CubicO group peptidase (beta-lactamase class C family)
MVRAALVLLWICSSAALARQDIQELADGLVNSGSPGAVVMMIEGDIQLTSAAGVRQSTEDVRVDLSDAWHLGSNTKAMTAVIAARLVERDLIDWDTTLGETLGPRFDQIDPALAEATLADLLQHRSGMQANAGRLTSLALAGILGDRDPQADRHPYLRELLRNPANDGGEFLYSNAGYVAAAMMLEEVSGESWEGLIQTELFDELGLDSAGFGPPRGEQPRGHRTGWGRLTPVGTDAGADNPPAMNPAGRVHMSMPDYAVFLRLVMAGARGEESDYLSRESWQTLLTPPDGADYAMGWGVGADGSLRHAGSNTMWFVQAVIWPDERRIAVAGVNEGRIDQIAPRIRNVLTALTAE